MLKRLLIFLIPFISIKHSNAQNSYPQKSTIATLYLQTDKQKYLAEETVWFKCYLMQSGLPATGITNLYTALLDGKGNKITAGVWPVNASIATGQIPLPKNYTDQWLTLCGYAGEQEMDSIPLYTTSFYYAGSDPINTTATNKISSALQFFAESGQCIANTVNNISFSCTNSNGLPFNTSGVIKNSQQEFVDSFFTEHDGMGVLQLYAQQNETYTAEWNDVNGNSKKTALPIVQHTGIVLHAEQAAQEVLYFIKANQDVEKNNKYFIVASQHDTTLYTAETNMAASNMVTGKIPVQIFNSGIVQLTVYNQQKQPLAERVIFVQNGDYTISHNIQFKTIATTARAKNEVEIDIPDSLTASLCVSITDANVNNISSTQSIFSAMFFGKQIRGYVHQPAYYFKDTLATTKKHLDLLLQTHGWRKYTAVKNQTAGNYISLKGKVIDNKGKAAKNCALVFMLKSVDSSKTWLFPTTDKEGRFEVNNLIFFDTVTLFYKIKSDVNAQYKILLEDEIGLTAPVKSGMISIEPMLADEEIPLVKNDVDSIYQVGMLKNKKGFEKEAKLLQDVNIKVKKAWYKDPIYLADQKYTSGLFRGGATALAFDVLQDSMATAKFDIYNYLVVKIPRLKIITKQFGKEFEYTNMFQEKINPYVYINESLVDNEQLQNIRIEDIAYVKFIPNFLGLREEKYGGFPPALAIYLKKFGDYSYQELKDNGINAFSKKSLVGYNTIKEFYTPDYSIDNTNDLVDVRTTLYWQPDIITNNQNKKHSIVFYNNNICKKFKMVITGMNEVGQLLYIEKTFE